MDKAPAFRPLLVSIRILRELIAMGATGILARTAPDSHESASSGGCFDDGWSTGHVGITDGSG
jgi:hypothetical protein